VKFEIGSPELSWPNRLIGESLIVPRFWYHWEICFERFYTNDLHRKRGRSILFSFRSSPSTSQCMLATLRFVELRCAAILRFAWACVQDLTCQLPALWAQTLGLGDEKLTVCFTQAGHLWQGFSRYRLAKFEVVKKAVFLSVRTVKAMGAEDLVFLFFSHTRAYTEPPPTTAAPALAL